MKTNRPYQTYLRNSLRTLLLILLMLAAAIAPAQININGKVFGGACQADVGGSTFVDIGADNFDIVINAVYGGNDISGTVGANKTATTMPFDPEVNIEATETTDAKTYVDNTFDAFIRTKLSTKKLFIGKLFGGGNGEYDYTTETENPYFGLSAPNLAKTYLQINGGTIAQLFGGGNNATVTANTTICIDNKSTVVNSIKDGSNNEILTDNRIQAMDLNTTQTHVEGEFQFGRVFGGNNFADMAIRPRWFLKKGKIRDLYSGGNEGRMTSPEGLLLEIKADEPDADKTAADVLWIGNVYGGCRKADVIPLDNNGIRIPTENIQLVDAAEHGQVPAGYAARVRVLSGYVNNVYGGNDISGTVYGGNTVGIFTTIHGDVYGGGNGSYAYTDHASLKYDSKWGDFYYDPGSNSVEALNAHRPNAERVSIRVSGTEDKTTIIKGSLYAGGNSATLEKKSDDISHATAELKIGSYVIIDKVFLGNNGANMIASDILAKYADDNFSSLKLKGENNVFETYMEGCAMRIDPDVVFDDGENSPDVYVPYSTRFGSFYCGGNVGSIIKNGLISIPFEHEVIIYDKLVGGCNEANVDEGTYNAAYKGGLKGNPDESGNKLELNLKGLKIQPKRWNNENTDLEWNTYIGDNKNVIPADASIGEASEDDKNRRFKGGNIYGGCFNSGYVNGNVVINIESSIVDRTGEYGVFDSFQTDGDTGESLYGHDSYNITVRRSGVILDEQGMDVLASALNVFGGGKGAGTEINGSTTINLTNGYVFQIFGGSEQGYIGVKDNEGNYVYNPAYSTYINLHGDVPGVARGASGDSPNMAEAEFIYGGGFEGIVCGDTHIKLGNGRIFNSFAGSCNANILGHTETYIGVSGGFPYIRDHIYGGNDLGGSILGSADFSGQVAHIDKVYKYDADNNSTPGVLTASAYMEFIQGRVVNIFGGCYGDYDYQTEFNTINKPYLKNAFVNIKPSNNGSSLFSRVFGAGQGLSGERAGDNMQDRSYVHIDILEDLDNFKSAEVFGAGAYDGLGMRTKVEADASEDDKDAASAIVDLVSGQIKAVYGGSLNEGITRRTVVNVPVGSTINLNKIFGGAYGNSTPKPCDVYEANVNYGSSLAQVSTIYGGNNSKRRTIFGKVNISSPVWSDKIAGYQATVYGAGCGEETWSEYTEVNLENGAKVYKVYGGGEDGKVFNAESVQAYMQAYKSERPTAISESDYVGNWATAWKNAWKMGDYYTPDDDFDNYTISPFTLSNSLVTQAEIDDRANVATTSPIYKKYNTNVRIKEGATVTGYAYGGGKGAGAVISGTTYIALLGGTVEKDLYAAGEGGPVEDMMAIKNFTASSNAYVKGGTVRNAYGGGWEGHVGYHQGAISNSNESDVLAETHVVVGVVGDDAFLSGAPAVTRNVYGGGEGGSVYGSAYITVNNGHIGYRYENTGSTAEPVYQYVEELDDAEENDNLLDDAGNVFGGGYVANSYTDFSYIKMYGGIVRGCLYGGGEIGPIGRGTTLSTAPAENFTFINDNAKIYKGGGTHIELYSGHVMRDVFGGGRGVDNWGGDGTKFISAAVLETLDLSSKGYIFGSTDVHIRGGEIGTREGVAKGYGNVFGGGNLGFVYSATGTKHGTRGETDLTNGLPTNGGGYYYSKWDDDRTKCELSLDCNVVVEPYALVTGANGIEIGDNSYAKGEYVPIEDLNKLKDKNSDKSQWDLIDYESGVTIHNAVFAGGNVTMGSDQVYANIGTVFGNVTAALRDAYNRDLITIGTEHVGGLYGDGNLTMVDGYREVHIDNYGTDYYVSDQEISKEIYNGMSDRERAYFVLNYKCIKACTGENGDIAVGKRFTSDEIKAVFDYDHYNDANFAYHDYINEDGTPNPEYFDELGFCSLYAGRLLNTIQRCDMAAIWGSRIVLQGARDRVPEKADYTRYTLNRVGELSLNQRESEATGEKDENKKHGNYFGIYSVVNYLGNLTSDVFFTEAQLESSQHLTSIRTTSSSNENNMASTTYNGTTTEYGQTTFYQWKAARPHEGNRNNATSVNKVSLASGVYLEIIREESEKLDHTEWGLITGVVELDLIDVKTGLGGGYVYARNEHGVKTWNPGWDKVNLSPYNLKARTYKRFTYSDSDLKEIETSGNFVHNTKQIVDDCYPNANEYLGANASPAHYWYIKGNIYVYDQYISAFTGSANAYAETVSIPLTISAASHGRMTLRDVQPNLYAYYGENNAPLGMDGSVIVNGVTYNAGDPIDYWSYQTLSDSDKRRFVKEVYTTIAECTIGENTYPKGYILLPGDETNPAEGTYRFLKNHAPTKDLDTEDNDPTVEPYVHHVEQDTDVAFDFVFRPANNIAHDEGYILTFDMTNPGAWDDYYTPQAGAAITKEAYNRLSDTEKESYIEGPTYNAGSSGVYGQRKYTKGEIITKGAVDAYPTTSVSGRDDQAAAEPAYVVTEEIKVTNTLGNEQHLYPGAPVYRSDYSEPTWTSMSGKVSPAKVCTSTLQVSEKEYVYAGNLLSVAEYEDLKGKIKTKNGYTGTDADNQAETFLNTYLDDAYCITKTGLYGGAYYEQGKPYRALETWCSMSKDDREHFSYNYDGLDLLIDPAYGGTYDYKPQYDGELDPKVYSVTKPIDFEAEFNPSAAHVSALASHYDNVNKQLVYTDENNNEIRISQGYDHRIKREAYDEIPNERVHWSPITVTDPGDYYVVKEAFILGDIPYTVGQVIEKTTFNSLTQTQQRDNIEKITFTANYAKQKVINEVPQVDAKGNPIYEPVNYYFCRERYQIGEKGEGVGFTNLGITDTKKDYGDGDWVEKHILIDADNYRRLTNLQTGFVVYGAAPVETATLYVSRESDIYNLSKEKIITVIYMFEYQESDESGNNITPISERHIVNIHINFESGIPEIGQLTKPNTVLPGSTIGLKIPNVEPGAFDITSSGWEIFSNEDDALLHNNGQEYENNGTPMYWYQNGYWVAFYAQTYLGKTYSNAVQLSVANYHDIKDVLSDQNKGHHMYIDHQDVARAPKIYINDYSADGLNGLDLLRNLIELSNGHPLSGHAALDARVRGGHNLDFILHTNISHTGGWTPIANAENECFSGNLHGDGYYISGLDQSLFKHLCGNVYNLGVMGSFASAGIAETGEGYIENCWTKTTGTSLTGYPVFGNPSRDADDSRGPIQLKNCYYPESNTYSTYAEGYNHGKATQKPEAAFYNGEIAYDLNGFYLYKRYYDHELPTGGEAYHYYVDGKDTNDNPILVLKDDGKYPYSYEPYIYVEDRFGDGDFIYAEGTIPEEKNIRLHEETDGTNKYFPIWPDDYIFFGQKLNYGHVDGISHQEVPSHINKSGTRLVTSDVGNRVYRATGYFLSKSDMRAVYFNPYAVFAKTKKDDNSVKAYENMTAIDFDGSTYTAGYKEGWTKISDSDANEHFFLPLLDDDGLSFFRNIDLTRNLLVYTGTSTTAATKTDNVVSARLLEPPFAETDATYHTVAVADASGIQGHWVQNGIAIRDHLLVDKQDFDCPIQYSMGEGKRMWYQRTPDKFVTIESGGTKGWENISLPFEVKLVTTQQKGEISHFYGNSTSGHEYWLREFAGNVKQKKDQNGNSVAGVFTADFNSMAASTSDNTYNYGNTFLWDYYYSKNPNGNGYGDDANGEDYKQYYNTGHSFENYPMQRPGTAYLIGFPGTSYYEFDLSGKWIAQNTASLAPAKLDRQTITFASKTGVTIGISDNEKNATADGNGNKFMPNYLTKNLTTNDYLLNDDGNSFDKATTTSTTVPFRPYLYVVNASANTRGNERQDLINSVVFGGDMPQIKLPKPDKLLGIEGDLIITSGKKKIIVESEIHYVADVRIVTPAGITLTSFAIEPGETVETRIENAGVYIVYADNGKYVKKVIVK